MTNELPSVDNSTEFFAPVEVPDGFKKAVGVVQVAMGKLGFLHRKVYNVLLANAYEGLGQGKDQFTISVAALAEMSGFKSNDHQQIYDCCRDLMKSEVLTIDFDEGAKGKRRKPKRKGGTTLISSFDIYKEGTIQYAFSPKMADLLHDPEQYIWMTLSAQSKFDSKYELSLFENTLRYVGVGSTGFKDLEEWRDLLGANEKTYDEFKRLNAFVIKPATKGINEKSGILIEPEFEREKRRVARIKFSVKENPQTSLLDFKEHDRMRCTTAYGDAQAVGLKEVEIFYWIETKGEAYLAEAVSYVKSQKKVTNPTAYLVRALREGYGEKTPEEREKAERAAKVAAERQAGKEVEERHEEQAKALQAEYNDYVREQGRAVIERLTPAQREELKIKARERMAMNRFSRKRFDDAGGDYDRLGNTMPDKLVKSYIAREAVSLFGDPATLELEQFANGREIPAAVIKKINR